MIQLIKTIGQGVDKPTAFITISPITGMKRRGKKNNHLVLVTNFMQNFLRFFSKRNRYSWGKFQDNYLLSTVQVGGLLV